MSDRPPLALILLSADPERLRAGLLLARCEVALGGSARLFIQGAAVALLRPPIAPPQDAAWRATGEPALAALLDEALDDGVAISLCQTGLTLADIPATDVDPRLLTSGPLAFLATAGAGTRLLTL